MCTGVDLKHFGLTDFGANARDGIIAFFSQKVGFGRDFPSSAA